MIRYDDLSMLQLFTMIKKAFYVKSAEYEKDFPEAMVLDLVMVGRSNVGKSSLINSLTNNRKLARVSKSPGCTKLINFFSVNNNFYIVDLPGYGFAKISRELKEKWAEIIEKYLICSRKKLVLILVDAKRGIEKEEKSMVEFLKYHNIPYEVVYTKSDKLKRNELRELNKKNTGIYLSSKTGEGKDELLGAIKKCLELKDTSDTIV